MVRILPFYLYKNYKSGQISHTGPLIVQHQNHFQAIFSAMTTEEQRSSNINDLKTKKNNPKNLLLICGKHYI